MNKRLHPNCYKMHPPPEPLNLGTLRHTWVLDDSGEMQRGLLLWCVEPVTNGLEDLFVQGPLGSAFLSLKNVSATEFRIPRICCAFKNTPAFRVTAHSPKA